MHLAVDKELHVLICLSMIIFAECGAGVDWLGRRSAGGWRLVKISLKLCSELTGTAGSAVGLELDILACQIPLKIIKMLAITPST